MMRMNAKKVLSILLILFVAGAAVLFADAVSDAYRDGYLKGYSDNSVGSNASPSSRAANAANSAGYRTTAKSGTSERAEQQRLRDSYISGYKQGWEDKAKDKDNRFL